VLANGHVIATGNVTLLAGDNLDVGSGSMISGTVVTLHSDNASADAGTGSTLTTRNTITGSTVQLLGDVDVDNFVFNGFSGTVLVNGAAGADTTSLNLTGGTVTTQESLTLSSNVTTNASSSTARINGTLSLGAATRTFSVADGAAADDLIVGATLSGTGGLTKSSAGTMVLTAHNTYTGTTSVTGGTLVVDGLQASSPVMLSAGGTLSGRGTVSTLTSTGGLVTPGGASAGRLSSGNVALSSATTYTVQLNGLAAATQHDQLSVTGTVNLGGAILNVSPLGFQPTAGNTFVIVANDSTDQVQGTFAGLANQATFNVGNVQYRIRYNGGDGNDVTLEYLNTNSAFAQRTITSPIYEGGIAVLTGRPVDPNPLDEFILLVNWGDGSPQERHVFPPATQSVRLEHRYLESRDTPYVVDLQWVDQLGGGNRDVLSVQVNDTVGVPLLAVGADASRPAQVRVYNGDDGSERFTILAYAAPFNGGVRVALGDITGDGTDDIITAIASRGGPHVRVFNGVTGEPLPGLFGSFVAYDPSFTGGVFVASGDVNGDGRDDIITAPAAGLSSTVRVFSGIDGSEIGNFLAFEPGWLNGLSIAMGDVNADGQDDIIVGRGRGGVPEVRVFSGRDFSLLRSFNAYAAAFTGGVFVGSGDINGDGKEDLITGPGRGGGPQVRVLSGEDNTRLASFFAYAQQFTGGVQVAASDINGDGLDDIVTGAGPGGGPQMRVFSGADLTRLKGFFTFETSFSGGIFVAGAPHGAGALWLASDTARSTSPAEPLNDQQLDLIRVAALEHLAAVGLADEDLDRLAQANVGISDLPGDLLGLARGKTVRIDRDGAGQGWFVDETPETSDDLLPGRVDLLSVVLHEFGHLLGWEHGNDLDDFMFTELGSATRVGVAETVGPK
jgi:autotransporter-associated beta strand protein